MTSSNTYTFTNIQTANNAILNVDGKSNTNNREFWYSYDSNYDDLYVRVRCTMG